MVRIPLMKHQPKPDSSQGSDGSGKDAKGKDIKSKGKDSKSKDAPWLGKDQPKASLPASSADRGEQGQQYVLGTEKRIPFPLKRRPREEGEGHGAVATEIKPAGLAVLDRNSERQPAEAAFVAKIVLPESAPEVQEAIQTSVMVTSDNPPIASVPADKAQEPTAEVAVLEEIPSRMPLPPQDRLERASGASSIPALDALVVLRAMPDHIFRIGSDGVSPILPDSQREAAHAGTGLVQSTDGKAPVDTVDKSKVLEKIIIEELARQSEPHTRRALETRQLQTFEFQVRDEKGVRHYEARLTALDQSETLAIVRDVTLLKQTYDALTESRNELENHLKEKNAELIRVNKMLKVEVELREEQEDVLKKNFRRLESLLDETVGAITLIVEKKDPHVADHQRRVCQLACAIAQEMNSKNDRMRAVRMAAQLHDLGKIFIPAEILRKPGKLTDAELSVVRTHPDTDYEILKRINFPISIADVVRQHHERMDGSGYPQKLKGDDILMEARIIAVADVIEGMVFERPYRVAPGLEAALKEISDKKGTLYDSAVADACLKLFAENRFQFESMPPQEDAEKVRPAADRRDH